MNTTNELQNNNSSIENLIYKAINSEDSELKQESYEKLLSYNQNDIQNFLINTNSNSDSININCIDFQKMFLDKNEYSLEYCISFVSQNKYSFFSPITIIKATKSLKQSKNNSNKNKPNDYIELINILTNSSYLVLSEVDSKNKVKEIIACIYEHLKYILYFNNHSDIIIHKDMDNVEVDQDMLDDLRTSVFDIFKEKLENTKSSKSIIHALQISRYLLIQFGFEEFDIKILLNAFYKLSENTNLGVKKELKQTLIDLILFYEPEERENSVKKLEKKLHSNFLNNGFFTNTIIKVLEDNVNNNKKPLKKIDNNISFEFFNEFNIELNNDNNVNNNNNNSINLSANKSCIKDNKDIDLVHNNIDNVSNDLKDINNNNNNNNNYNNNNNNNLSSKDIQITNNHEIINSNLPNTDINNTNEINENLNNNIVSNSFEEQFNEYSWQEAYENNKKWIDKKKHIDNFTIQISDLNLSIEDLLEDNIKYSKSNLAQIQCDYLTKYLEDPNVNVVNSALIAFKALINKLGPFLPNKQVIIESLFEKFKENNKLNKEIINTLLLIIKVTKLNLKEVIELFLLFSKDNKAYANSIQFKVNFLDFCFLAISKTYINVLNDFGNFMFNFLNNKYVKETSPEIKHNVVNCLSLLKLRGMNSNSNIINRFYNEDNKLLSSSLLLKINNTLENELIGYDPIYDIEQIEEENNVYKFKITNNIKQNVKYNKENKNVSNKFDNNISNNNICLKESENKISKDLIDKNNNNLNVNNKDNFNDTNTNIETTSKSNKSTNKKTENLDNTIIDKKTDDNNVPFDEIPIKSNANINLKEYPDLLTEDIQKEKNQSINNTKSKEIQEISTFENNNKEENTDEILTFDFKDKKPNKKIPNRFKVLSNKKKENNEINENNTDKETDNIKENINSVNKQSKHEIQENKESKVEKPNTKSLIKNAPKALKNNNENLCKQTEENISDIQITQNKELNDDIPIKTSKINELIMTDDNKLSSQKKKKLEEEEFERRLEEQMKLYEGKDNTNNKDNNDINNKNSKKKTKDENEIAFESAFKNSNEILSLLNSVKWEERRDGFNLINEVIETEGFNGLNNSKFSAENYFNLLRNKLKDFKELNFNVNKSCMLAYISLFERLNNTDHNELKLFNVNKTTYINVLVKGFCDKMADSKLNQVLKDLYYILIDIYNAKDIINIIKLVISPNENNKEKTKVKKPSNQLLIAYASFYESLIVDYGPKYVPSKDFVDYSILLANNTANDVRNAATSLIKTLYKYLGEDVKTLINNNIKEATWKVIEAELSTVEVIKCPENPKSKKIKNNTVASANNNNNNNKAKEINTSNFDSGLIQRQDISKKITPKLMKDLKEGKWPEKKEAAESIEGILKSFNNKILPNGLADLFNLFKNKLNDGNKNYVKLIVNLINKFVLALNSNFKSFVKIVGEKIISNWSDSYAPLREDVTSCIESWGEFVGYESPIVLMIDGLKNDNNDYRTEALKFINKHKDQAFGSGLINVNTIKDNMIKPFIICLLDRNSNIRAIAEEIIAYLIKLNGIGTQPFMTSIKEYKQAKYNSLYSILEKYVKSENYNTNSNVLKVDADYNKNTILTEPNETNITTTKTIDKTNNISTKNVKSSEKDKHTKSILDKKKLEKSMKNVNPLSISNNKKNKDTSFEKVDNLINNNNNNNDNQTTIISNNTLDVVNNNINSNSLILNQYITNLNPMIYNQNITLKNNKERRLDHDRKFKYNAEHINLNNHEEYNKLLDLLRHIFVNDFIDTRIASDDTKNISDGFLSIRESFNENSLKVLFEYFDVLLKFLLIRSLSFNQNPSFNKSMLEFLEDFYDNLNNYYIFENNEVNNNDNSSTLSINDVEAHTIVFLMLEKLAIPKFKDFAKLVLDKYTSIINPNRVFSLLINFYNNRSSKMKIEILELCTSIVISDTLILDINISKEVKFLVKIFISNIDQMTKSAIFNLLYEIYLKMGDQFWSVCTGIPDNVKENLYSYFQEQMSAYNLTSNNTSSTNLSNNNSILSKSNKSLLTQRNNDNNNNKNKFNKTNKSKAIINNSKQNKINNKNINNLNTSRNINNNINNNNNNNNINQNTVYITNSSLSSVNNQIINNTGDLLNVLSSLNEGEVSERINHILLIHELVYTKFITYKEILIPSIDIIIESFCKAINSIFNEHLLIEDIPIKYGKYLLTVLYKIASNIELISKISFNELFLLSEEVMTNLLIEDLENIGENQEGVIIIKSLNSTMLRILENCDKTDVICVLLELIIKFRRDKEKFKISTLAIKCLLKLSNKLHDIIDYIIIYKVVNTLTKLIVDIDSTNPDLISTNQSEQMIIKYIKNLFSEIVKIKGKRIIQEYNKAAEINLNLFKEDKFIRRWIKNILTSLNVSVDDKVFITYNYFSSKNFNNENIVLNDISNLNNNVDNNNLVFPLIDELIVSSKTESNINLNVLNKIYKTLFINNLEFNMLENYFINKDSSLLYKKLLNNWSIYKMNNICNLDKINNNPMSLNQAFGIENNINICNNKDILNDVRMIFLYIKYINYLYIKNNKCTDYNDNNNDKNNQIYSKIVSLKSKINKNNSKNNSHIQEDNVKYYPSNTTNNLDNSIVSSKGSATGNIARNKILSNKDIKKASLKTNNVNVDNLNRSYAGTENYYNDKLNTLSNTSNQKLIKVNKRKSESMSNNFGTSSNRNSNNFGKYTNTNLNIVKRASSTIEK